MVDAANQKIIRSKRKAITALFPYAVWQKKDGHCEMFDIFLHAAQHARSQFGFMWYLINPFITVLLSKESDISLKQAVILVSPYLPWLTTTNNKGLTKLLAETALVVPYTEEISQSMVGALLQIIAYATMKVDISIHISMWLWLNKRPSLPPIYYNHDLGGHQIGVQKVRALRDTEILTSYLLVVWSEWNKLVEDTPDEMVTSIREDLSGIGAVHYREDLLHHLDQVLGQLDLGLPHLCQHKPGFSGSDLTLMKEHYGEFKKVLLEVDREANNLLTRKSPRSIIFQLLMPVDISRIPLNIHVCNLTSVPIGCTPHS